MKNKKTIIIIILLVLALSVLAVFFFLKKAKPLSEPDVSEEDMRQEIIDRQLEELNALREERRQGEEYVPPTEEDIQRQLGELEALRNK